MITLDTTNIDTLGDEVYSVERGSRVKVFIDGYELRGCVYCNITRGLAICVKRDLSGNMMLAEGSIVHELITGVITVSPIRDSNDGNKTNTESST